MYCMLQEILCLDGGRNKYLCDQDRRLYTRAVCSVTKFVWYVHIMFVLISPSRYRVSQDCFLFLDTFTNWLQSNYNVPI